MRTSISLNLPGMTSLHKAGLGGLYLTLRTFEKKGISIPGLSWQLEPFAVQLDWNTNDLRATFAAFIDKSFLLEEGFIVLTGLEFSAPLSIDEKYRLYVALKNSFLQFGPHRPTGKESCLTYEIDDQTIWIKDFAPIKSFRHQKAVDDFVASSTEFKKTVEAAGWLYPGGGQRHVAHNNTKLNEPLELALALLFAPVGVVFYNIKSRTKGRKIKLALVIPDVRNLDVYAEIRQFIAARGTLECTASSASDAALRLLVALKSQYTRNEIELAMGEQVHCRIVTFGIVSWNEKQKSRTYTRAIVGSNLKGLENYHRAAALFPNRWQRVHAKSKKGKITEPERSFVASCSAREFIADNVARGHHWYYGLNEFLKNEDAREQIGFERKELHQMVETAQYDTTGELLFIRICHESWRRRMGKLGQRARRENTQFGKLVNKEAERLRNSIARCKNAETLRETVIDFWSRSGANEMLRGEGLSSVWSLFDEKNWKKARDLALLALISYQPQNRTEEEALTAAVNLEDQEND